MKIRFIAHAGFVIEHDSTSIAIDPWFFSSDFETPVLQGLSPKERTIDFQIPPARNKIEEFTPKAILISHLHTHHSPLREIQQLIRQSPNAKVSLGLPPVPERVFSGIKDSLRVGIGDKEVQFQKVEFSTHSFWVDDIKVTGLTHTAPQHTAWLIETPTGSFLHIADSLISRLPLDRRIDSLWEPFRNLNPDFLAVSSAGHMTRMLTGQVKWIYENASLSPIEAARLTQFISPKTVSLMGIYQHSIWSSRNEYSFPPGFAEDQFRWAMDYLAPEIETTLLRPGDVREVRSTGAERNLAKIQSGPTDLFDDIR